MNQMDKNTVSSENQLQGAGFVYFMNKEGKGKRVMFVGNSITLHGVNEGLGWFLHCGMAASAPEKDYVHLLAGKISEKYEDAAFCICQVASWERAYKNGSDVLKEYEEARNFGADIIVMRMIENCPGAEFDGETFRKEYKNLIDYLNGTGNAEIICTTGFWKHPGDGDIEKVAKDNGYGFVYLGDLGELDEMKAIGLFEHSGVANHPGDKGMEVIAERIFEQF